MLVVSKVCGFGALSEWKFVNNNELFPSRVMSEGWLERSSNDGVHSNNCLNNSLKYNYSITFFITDGPFFSCAYWLHEVSEMMRMPWDNSIDLGSHQPSHPYPFLHVFSRNLCFGRTWAWEVTTKLVVFMALEVKMGNVCKSSCQYLYKESLPFTPFKFIPFH